MNILVAYDGTKEAKEAARLACKHAKAFNGRIILAYSMVGGPEIPRKEFEHAEKELQSQEITLKEEGFDCETLLSVRGLETGEDIIKIAEEKKAEEIIIGIQRRSKVGKLLFGSTAQYIILNAPCPVVTVR
jgi:nucleotide-binding universal stress UspA family protein